MYFFNDKQQRKIIKKISFLAVLVLVFNLFTVGLFFANESNSVAHASTGGDTCFTYECDLLFPGDFGCPFSCYYGCGCWTPCDCDCDDGDTQPCITTDGYNGEEVCSDCSWGECQSEEFCGDGMVNGPEECDDGNNTNSDGCSATCTTEQPTEPVCGNGELEVGEECDDGNLENGDGCSSICTNEQPTCNAPVGVVINEIMQNPAAVTDANGEWFEVYNTTDASLDLEGCVVSDNSSNAHTINSLLIVPANGYAVLARKGEANGGVSPDYVYGAGFTLGNTDDEIIITCCEEEIDRVEYDGGPNWPNPNGAAMILSSPGVDNNIGANWCVSSSGYGDGDLGTPGAINDSCNGASPVCGNDIKEGDEECDGADGVTAGFHCTSECVLEEDSNGGGSNDPVCGNGAIEAGEECDDGNLEDGDGCSSQCVIEENGGSGGSEPVCGNNEIEGDEECDGYAGVLPDGYDCTDQCVLELREVSGSGSGGGGAGLYFIPPAIVPGSGGSAPAPSSPVESAPTVLGVSGAPLLTINKTISATFANPGDDGIIYEIIITNNGELDAVNVVVIDILPDGLIFSADGNQEKEWSLGDLAPGAAETLAYEVIVEKTTAAGVYTNTAQAQADNNDPVMASADLEVRQVEVLAASGWNEKEFIGLLTLLVATIGWTIRRRYSYA